MANWYTSLVYPQNIVEFSSDLSLVYGVYNYLPFTESGKCKFPASFCGCHLSPISHAGKRQKALCPWSSIQTELRPHLFNNCTVSVGPGGQVGLDIGCSHFHRFCFRINGFSSCLGCHEFLSILNLM